MKRSRIMPAMIMSLVVAGVTICQAEQMLNLKIGPLWPRDIYIHSESGKRTAWEGAVEIGDLFDRRIGIGGGVDLMWHIISFDSTSAVDTPTIMTVNKEEKRFMFPVYFFMMFDPLPDLIIHPVIRGQIGFNMLAYVNKSFPNGQEQKSKDSGFYMGVIGKVAIEGHYDLGKQVAIFAGFEYQWSEVRRKIEDTDNQYTRQSLYGPGIRMGFQFLL